MISGSTSKTLILKQNTQMMPSFRKCTALKPNNMFVYLEKEGNLRQQKQSNPQWFFSALSMEWRGNPISVLSLSLSTLLVTWRGGSSLLLWTLGLNSIQPSTRKCFWPLNISTASSFMSLSLKCRLCGGFSGTPWGTSLWCCSVWHLGFYKALKGLSSKHWPRAQRLMCS